MKITAIVGSYRKGGMTDQAVDVMLEAAREAGAETRKIYLLDKQVAFCTNCRTCMQQPGTARARCELGDEMEAILEQLDGSDGIILASPVNFGTVTALMKRFIERLAVYAYWPWGAPAPKLRKTQKDKRAVVVASSAAPRLLARWSTSIVGLLKHAADVLGAKTIGVLFIGLAARTPNQPLPAPVAKRARHLGRKLAIQRQGAALKGKKP